MRSLLTVTCVVLIYVVGLMTATGTSLWTAAVSDQEAAAIFGGDDCATWYNNIYCSTGGSSCNPLTGFGRSGTTNTIRRSTASATLMCAGGSNTSCSFIDFPETGCATGG